MASVGPIGDKIRRNTHILESAFLSQRSSSFRVPDLGISMAG